MCDHSPNREAAMVVIDPGTPERQGRDGVWCDPCLVPLVKALNDGGLPTVASCCGHGKRPGNIALADGRELVLMPDYEAARALDDHFHNLATEPDTRAEGCDCASLCSMGPTCPGGILAGLPGAGCHRTAPAVAEGTDWFREQHDRAKERNAQVPPHARMVVTNPELSAHHRPAAVAEGTDVRKSLRIALRDHAALPGLPLWCGCGHRADTPYNRETHLTDVILAERDATQGGGS